MLMLERLSDEFAAVSVGHTQHMDIRSLTVLLGGQWGLQILTSGPEAWAFVEPRSNHAVMSVEDNLEFSSRGGQLASVVHRVIPLEGNQKEDRWSIAYFMRVNDDLR